MGALSTSNSTTLMARERMLQHSMRRVAVTPLILCELNRQISMLAIVAGPVLSDFLSSRYPVRLLASRMSRKAQHRQDGVLLWVQRSQ